MPIVAAILVFGVHTPTAAQTNGPPMPGGMKWSLIDAIGYGGLGFGVGLITTWDMEGSDLGPPGTALAVTAATTVAGTVAGAMIGKRAQNTMAEGGRLGGAHRAAVVGGVIMAGGTVGAVAAIPLINGEGEGTFLGSDEQTVALLVLAGGALGSVFAWKQRDQLAFRSVSVTPALVGIGRYGLHMRVSF